MSILLWVTQKVRVKLRFYSGSVTTDTRPFMLMLHRPSHPLLQAPCYNLLVCHHSLPEPLGSDPLKVGTSSFIKYPSPRCVVGTWWVVHMHAPMQISIAVDDLGIGVTHPEAGCAHGSSTAAHGYAHTAGCMHGAQQGPVIQPWAAPNSLPSLTPAASEMAASQTCSHQAPGAPLVEVCEIT